MGRAWPARCASRASTSSRLIAPNRQARRRTGKSDPADAVEAARAALSGRAQGAGKTRDGNVEAIRALVVAKRSARATRIKSLNQIRHLGFTAPTSCATGCAALAATTLAMWRRHCGHGPTGIR